MYDDDAPLDYTGGVAERMFALASSLQSPTIVEIGVRNGNSFRLWLDATQHNGGRVIGIDIQTTYAAVPWARGLLIVDSAHRVAQHWALPIDLLYIDGDHTTEGFQTDLNAWYPHVKAGGHILIHDITNDGHIQAMVPVLAKFCATEQLTWETWPNECGVAHVVKPIQSDAKNP